MISQNNERFYPPNLVRSALTGFFNEENEIVEEGVAKRKVFENDMFTFSLVQIARGSRFIINIQDEELYYFPVYGQIVPQISKRKIVINNISSFQNAQIILISKKSEWKEPDESIEVVKEKELFTEEYVYDGLKSRINLEMKASIVTLPPDTVFDAIGTLDGNIEEYLWYIPLHPNDTLPLSVSRVVYKLVERVIVKNNGTEPKTYMVIKLKGVKSRRYF